MMYWPSLQPLIVGPNLDSSQIENSWHKVNKSSHHSQSIRRNMCAVRSPFLLFHQGDIRACCLRPGYIQPFRNRLVFRSTTTKALSTISFMSLFSPRKKKIPFFFSSSFFWLWFSVRAGMQSQQISENLVGFLPQENLTFLQQQASSFSPCLFYTLT